MGATGWSLWGQFNNTLGKFYTINDWIVAHNSMNLFISIVPKMDNNRLFIRAYNSIFYFFNL